MTFLHRVSSIFHTHILIGFNLSNSQLFSYRRTEKPRGFWKVTRNQSMLWNKWSTCSFLTKLNSKLILAGAARSIATTGKSHIHTWPKVSESLFDLKDFQCRHETSLQNSWRAHVLHVRLFTRAQEAASFRALFRCRPGSGMAQPRFALKQRLVRLLARAPPQRTNGLMRGMIVSGSQDRGNSLMIVIAPLAA